MRHTILITGAVGYLGSALCTGLSRDHDIIGLSPRPPSQRLAEAAPSVTWETGDVVEPGCLDCIFRNREKAGSPIDYIIHFAAYTDYGEKWHDEYSNTNVFGTRNVIDTAIESGVGRILFAGSIAALEPPRPGEMLTEKSSVYADIAYSKSKALGEELLSRYSKRVRSVVLRLGGVFTDWCELPPLFSIMNQWSRPISGRLVPGQGESGFPYIHRKDVVRIVKKIIEMDDRLDRFEVLFASPSGCTCHKEIFPVIRHEFGYRADARPLNVPPFLVKHILRARHAVNRLAGKNSYERAWMVRYIDRPLRVDAGYTCSRLNWSPTPGLDILTRLPALVDRFRRNRRLWLTRNIDRNEQRYDYDPD